MVEPIVIMGTNILKDISRGNAAIAARECSEHLRYDDSSELGALSGCIVVR